MLGPSTVLIALALAADKGPILSAQGGADEINRLDDYGRNELALYRSRSAGYLR
jgi:hypothetical protein